MSSTVISSYVRLPVFSEVIDGLASGLGISRNKEDALAHHRSFDTRIKAYNGSDNRTGLEKQLLELIAGSDEELRKCMITQLINIETEITNARAIPLITDALEVEGLRHFIQIWVIPWIAQLLNAAHQYPKSILMTALKLLEIHIDCIDDCTRNYVDTWKRTLRQAIPDGVNVPEFRSILTKIDKRSQRKHSSIEQDLANLRDEIQSSIASKEEIDTIVDEIGKLYLAGMATMRLCAMAADIIPEYKLLTLLFDEIYTCILEMGDDQGEIRDNRIRMYWDYFDYDFTLSTKYKKISECVYCDSTEKFNQLRIKLHKSKQKSLCLPAVDFREGCWHLQHGRNDLAQKCFSNIIDVARNRQLGETASGAASFLIALRLIDSKTPKFQELTSLMRVRIDNMSQYDELKCAVTPTPFSQYSYPMKISSYDLHLIMCVEFFNNFLTQAGVSPVCNPLQSFDAALKNMIIKSREPDASLKKLERNKPAIVGTSIKPYQLLRESIHYRVALALFCSTDLLNLDAYDKLQSYDQLRLLRFIDPEQFQADLEEYNPSSWRS
ncbi:hypothetical protein [Acetobacter pasteurianus]|uniref:Uncharacterized protein n=1 Tax=Acetobacter pasteurianus NBRC 3188 TaxID=1226663 RepID=A0A401WZ23_ACEPA|nr:hypothetical protein [Acetobacter pasteurianus]GCD54567.1 hypothetical protein NBRC3188_3264 [Acetobacter pasteurianus NBRC 3188]